MQVSIAVVRWHLAAAAAGIALGEIFEAELTRCHAAPQNQTAVAIVGHDIIIRFHLHRNRRQGLVTHSGNMKMSLTLTIQILLAQVSVAAFQHRGQEPQFIFLAQRRHTA